MMKKKYAEMTAAERQAEYTAVQKEYEDAKALHLALNMARGKPGREQLELVMPILGVLTRSEQFLSDGVETRNYGEVAGIPAARRLFADILGCKPEQVFVGGNASLQLMYDAVSKAFTHGMRHSEKPWSKLDKVKWLCPVPGYDRHFKVTESFGVEMINIPMTADGPDMDMVEELIRDPAVKGMWNVPKYANPEGVVYSGDTIRRLAAMKPAAPDFMLMWDNAYCIHEFDGDFVPFPDIISLCAQYGNADMVYEFASTSKVTFPGAGVAVMASSEANIAYLTKLINVQTIGFDKINQLRHTRFFKNIDGLKAHMEKHADILRPKFEAVLNAFDQELTGLEIGSWVKPLGGYFISFDAMEGCAKAIVAKAKEAGVPIICAMGAGNKLDPARFEVADLAKTSVCPLARVMRHELKKRGIKKLKVVYSKEKPITPVDDMAISCKTNCICPPETERKCNQRRQVPGSTAFVPSVAGLIIAGEVIKDLIK